MHYVVFNELNLQLKCDVLARFIKKIIGKSFFTEKYFWEMF